MKKLLHHCLIIAAASCYVTSCTYNDINKRVDCSKSDLAIALVGKTDATSCKSIDAQMTMSATGGIQPYDFSLGDGIYQTNPVFERLAPGSYLVTVKDVNGCKSSVQVDIGAANSTLAATANATPDTDCFGGNGSINVSPSGGTSPYVVKIDNGQFGTSPAFGNLESGNHTVIVKDASDCQRVLIVSVPHGSTGVSYATDIVPIFNTSCNFSGCHGAGSTGRDWTKFSDVKSKAADIKGRTGNRSMPVGTGPFLTAQQIQLIACWVDDGAIEN